MNMYFERIGRVAVSVHNHLPPSNEEWDRWVDLCVEVHGDGGVVVAKSLGGSPSATQRAALAKALSGSQIASVVFLDSVVARGVVTAISWTGIRVRALAFGEYEKAQKYLNLSDEELAQVIASLRRLESKFAVALGM